MSHAKKQESMAHIQEKKEQPLGSPDIGLIRQRLTQLFRYSRTKENHSKELKENRRMKLHQILNTNKKIFFKKETNRNGEA